MADNYTKDWSDYELGKDYKCRINLYETASKNERFYSGDQWYGVRSNGMPTPVLNVVKRVLEYKVSQIMNKSVSLSIGIEGVGTTPSTPQEKEYLNVAQMLQDYIQNTLWKDLKQNDLNQQTLLDAAISGDGIQYDYFDMSKNTWQESIGDINTEVIDNVNVYPGNPNDAKIQTQPYIIVAFRELVSKLRQEALDNGLSQAEVDKIVSDSDYTYQSGDRAKIELDTSSNPESGKCICLIRFWKDSNTKTIWFRKSTKNVVINKGVDTDCRRYPISKMSWELRKNSFHGESECKYWIPNQISINKLLATLLLIVFMMGSPKVIYNRNIIKKW